MNEDKRLKGTLSEVSLFRFFGDGVQASPDLNYLLITIYTLSGVAYEDTIEVRIDCGGK